MLRKLKKKKKCNTVTPPVAQFAPKNNQYYFILEIPKYTFLKLRTLVPKNNENVHIFCHIETGRVTYS